MGRSFGFRRSKRETNLTPNYVVLTALVFATLGPLLVLFFNSLKSNAEIGQNPLGFPRSIQWGNYAEAWRIGGFSTTTMNSVILVVATVAGVLILGGMAAYSLARLDPP